MTTRHPTRTSCFLWILALTLFGCGTPPAPPCVEGPNRTLSSNDGLATASPPANASAIPTPSTTPTAVAPPHEASVVEAFNTEELEALTAELQNPNARVFRNVLLGEMPIHEQRESWMLSSDGRQLTVTCEHGVRTDNEDGFPEPSRWYTLGAASFVATDLVPGQAIASQYQRTRLRVIPKPVDRTYCDKRGYAWHECSQEGWTLCGDLGEALTLRCTPTTLGLLRPNAKLTYSRTGDEYDSYDVRLKPSARRIATGLSCAVEAPNADDPFHYYSFHRIGFERSVEAKPRLFFITRGPAVERVVYSDGLQYATFREAVLAPFDGKLPADLTRRSVSP